MERLFHTYLSMPFTFRSDPPRSKIFRLDQNHDTFYVIPAFAEIVSLRTEVSEIFCQWQTNSLSFTFGFKTRRGCCSFVQVKKKIDLFCYTQTGHYILLHIYNLRSKPLTGEPELDPRGLRSSGVPKL